MVRLVHTTKFERHFERGVRGGFAEEMEYSAWFLRFTSAISAFKMF